MFVINYNHIDLSGFLCIDLTLKGWHDYRKARIWATKPRRGDIYQIMKFNQIFFPYGILNFSKRSTWSWRNFFYDEFLDLECIFIQYSDENARRKTHHRLMNSNHGGVFHTLRFCRIFAFCAINFARLNWITRCIGWTWNSRCISNFWKVHFLSKLNSSWII